MLYTDFRKPNLSTLLFSINVLHVKAISNVINFVKKLLHFESCILLKKGNLLYFKVIFD